MEFSAIIDCSKCGTSFHAEWVTDLIDRQQLDEAPVADQQCPACQHVMIAVPYPGWAIFGEAG